MQRNATFLRDVLHLLLPTLYLHCVYTCTERVHCHFSFCTSLRRTYLPVCRSLKM
ncbi:hypothetical protein PF005_g12407 [Phytophthora fragariae]|uniref:Uncharacterized protein n=2 Tax=Phytophthora TaxID=4783 RepID=A0A6A3KW48_9STRA|nr:hypothetical protein PF003_g13047 [Phytophthora fragariae]KAE8972134.1 hypothetical protein PR002_g26608 [Phytophthora rubi]KAE8937033.1 hypothetical protein PF009_g13053 [Phytophthora fragariae]KAE8973856.1 hypothetical protein PR001_g26185 [Phytophthora rubi]KAE9007724.1 hypothetical protein PF011_g11003 [Phytophthora fragariae]